MIRLLTPQRVRAASVPSPHTPIDLFRDGDALQALAQSEVRYMDDITHIAPAAPVSVGGVACASARIHRRGD